MGIVVRDGRSPGRGDGPDAGERPRARAAQRGRPAALVHYGAKNKSDSVGQSWARLLKADGVEGVVRPLSFKYLRKTGSDLVRKTGKTGSDLVRKAAGLEVSQAYLAHTGKSVAERHYNNADFDQVTAALRAVRAQIEGVFGAFSNVRHVEVEVEAAVAATTAK